MILSRLIDVFDNFIFWLRIDRWFNLDPDAKHFRYMRYASIYIVGLIIGLMLRLKPYFHRKQ